ncbi:MAG: MAPEG family protein, partial [Glaciecola sp.]
AMATGSSDITDGLAYVLLGARLAQSLILLISTSPLAIQLRFATFLVQFAICAYWTWLFMQPLM